MPADPRELQRLVRAPTFQALSPVQQLDSFRAHLQDTDEEFAGFGDEQQQTVTRDVLQYYQPGFATTVGDVAEYVPVIGGAVRGYRAAEMGEPERPLTSVLPGEANTPIERASKEAFRDVAELAVAGGGTLLFRPFLSRLAARVAGGALESTAAAVGLGAGRTATTEALGAAALADRAIGAAGFGAMRKAAGEAARVALRERMTLYGLEQFTAGELFGVTQALERGIAGGEMEPFEDFVKTPLGVAALSLPFLGAGALARRYGAHSMERILEASGRIDPERLQTTRPQIAKIAEAIYRAGGGRVTREEAADITIGALTTPIAQQGEMRIVRDALRQSPEILGSEAGLRILRTQRALVEPDVTLVDGPYLRVSYTDERNRTVTEDLSDPAAQREFAKRVAGGDLTIDTVVGDQASVLRAGIRAGTPVAERVAPGAGRTGFVAEEGLGPVRGPQAEPGTAGLPALRTAEADELADLVAGAERELRAGAGPAARIEPAVRSPGDLAASPEAIRRVASEQARGVRYFKVGAKTGKIEELPATVDRVNIQARPGEVIVEAAPGRAPVVHSAGDKVPRGLQNLAVQRVVRQERARVDAAARAAAPRQLGTRVNEVSQLGGAAIEILPGPPKPPPAGATSRSTFGEPLRVVGDADVLGRALVEAPDGTRIRAQWRGEVGKFDVPDTFLLPPRAPELTVPTPAERGAAVGVRLDRLGAEMRKAGEAASAERTAARAQVVPGQVIHQTVGDMRVRGLRPSVEVVRVEGDRAWVRAAYNDIRETTVDAVAETVAAGRGKFAFDAAHPERLAAELGDTVRASVRERPIFDLPTTDAQRAADAAIADGLWVHERRSGLRNAPASRTRNEGDGIAAKTRERAARPANERTHGGNALVKGCKK